MIVVPGEIIVMIDCDDTLCLFAPTKEQLDNYGIDFLNPTTKEMDRIVPCRENIEQLKRHALRGTNCIVWTAAGVSWAVALVRALGIEKYVTACVSKPTFLIDDKDPSYFMPKPSYFKDSYDVSYLKPRNNSEK